MPRAIIDSSILDSLIRAKLATLEGCAGAKPLPVAPRDCANGGCNWHIPGWVGESQAVDACSGKIGHYLSFLQAQFDIPREKA